VALEHFRESPYSLRELSQAGLVVLHDLDLHEQLRAQAELGAIQQRDDACYVALILEALDTAPAWRLRQPDRFGDLGRR
jgi:hypothetical protein